MTTAATGMVQLEEFFGQAACSGRLPGLGDWHPCPRGCGRQVLTAGAECGFCGQCLLCGAVDPERVGLVCSACRQTEPMADPMALQRAYLDGWQAAVRAGAVGSGWDRSRG